MKDVIMDPPTEAKMKPRLTTFNAVRHAEGFSDLEKSRRYSFPPFARKGILLHEYMSGNLKARQLSMSPRTSVVEESMRHLRRLQNTKQLSRCLLRRRISQVRRVSGFSPFSRKNTFVGLGVGRNKHSRSKIAGRLAWQIAFARPNAILGRDEFQSGREDTLQGMPSFFWRQSVTPPGETIGKFTGALEAVAEALHDGDIISVDGEEPDRQTNGLSNRSNDHCCPHPVVDCLRLGRPFIPTGSLRQIPSPPPRVEEVEEYLDSADSSAIMNSAESLQTVSVGASFLSSTLNCVSVRACGSSNFAMSQFLQHLYTEVSQRFS
eukprot:Lankesteria_metandrocarpae@DN594_c0_g1_i2.p1